MLIALMTIMLLGGSGSAVLAYIADAGDAVKEVVAEEPRREEALGILKQLKKNRQQQDKAVKGLIKSLEADIRDHATAESEIDALWVEYFEQTRSANARMVELRFELREQLTREEWEQVFPAEV